MTPIKKHAQPANFRLLNPTDEKIYWMTHNQTNKKW